MKKMWLWMALLLPWVGLYAATPEIPEGERPEKYEFTLEEAVDFSLSNNKDLKKVQNDVLKALYVKREAISSYIPQISASLDYNNYCGATMSFMGQSIDFDPTSTLKAQASQLAFNGNAVVGIIMGKIGEQMAQLNEENQVRVLKSTVTQAYVGVLIAEASYTILEKNLEDIRDLAEKTRGMAEAGALEQTDADQLLVQVNLIENMLKNSERTLEIAYNALKVQLGLKVSDQLLLKDNLQELIESKNDQAILAMEYDIETDPNYQLVSKNLELAEKKKLNGIMNFLPTISAFYQYQYKILKSSMDMQPAHVVGLQASIPIFSGLKNTNVHRQARIDMYNAQLDKELVEDQLLIKEQQLRFNLRTAMEQYATQKFNVDVATRVFNSIQLKYEQGVKSSMDMTNANSDYLKAQSDYISSMMEVLNARTALEEMLGNL